MRILDDMIDFKYRKNDLAYFDLISAKESAKGDPKSLILHYRLNEAANAQDYTI